MSKCYIIGTPIGNLADITLRALETLKEVDVIATEDTRHTRILLDRYGIKKPLISYYKQKEYEGAAQILALINEGKAVGLVTDAGMPAVSDPGAVLVRHLRENGVRCEVIPGPSAVTSAVALAGLKGNGFIFLGFLPEKKKDRDALIQTVGATRLPIVVFTAPHDLENRLAFLYEKLGSRPVYVAREMTKMYETVYSGVLGDISVDQIRGEFVIVIDSPSTSEEQAFSLSIEESVNALMTAGLSKNDAIKQVASERGLIKNDVYKLFVNDKN